MPKKSNRDLLLTAANTIVQRDGAESLTLDAVARETAMSKGGVLYHFPTKDALLTAMIENWIANFEAAIQTNLEGKNLPGAWLRAFIKSTADEDPPLQTNALPLLAVIAHDHELLALVREHAETWQQQVANGFDPALATLLRLAADGLFWAELLNMAPPTGILRTQVIDLMLKLAKEDSA
jgi:AcrR family transcriptional regulator